MLTRIITALILLPSILYILIFVENKNLVCALFGILSCLCLFEFTRMFYNPLLSKFGATKGKAFTPYSILLFSAAVFILATQQTQIPLASIFLLSAFCYILLNFSVKHSFEFLLAHVVFAIIALSYCCLPFILMWEVYGRMEYAKLFILFIFIVSASDTGAYFSGSFFGKNKMSPLISPKKTWEGFLGGFLFSILVAVLYNAYFGIFSSVYLTICCAAGTALMAVVGDLVESSFKRFSKVKDSGELLPGHGGALDRADSIIFAIPFFHFMTSFI
jgi:phosphatidate cytidylyltransferase